MTRKAVFVAAIAAAFLSSTAAYAQCGGASWYGPGFNGKRAASGEIFNENAMTAAHRSLPFGTKVMVTDQRTGNAIEVTGTTLEGEAFDAAWLAVQAREHREAIEKFERASTSPALDTGVRSAAAQALTTLRGHADEIDDLRDSLGFE